MTFGFQFFNDNGSLLLSSEDETLVLLDIFDVASNSQGSRNYPGYANDRVFAMGLRQEPTSIPGRTWDFNNTWRDYPEARYRFGHAVTVTGTSSQATVNWAFPTYRFFSGGFIVTGVSEPLTPTTIYVCAI